MMDLCLGTDPVSAAIGRPPPTTYVQFVGLPVRQQSAVHVGSSVSKISRSRSSVWSAARVECFWEAGSKRVVANSRVGVLISTEDEHGFQIPDQLQKVGFHWESAPLHLYF